MEASCQACPEMLIRHQHGVQAVRALVMIRDVVDRNLRAHDAAHVEYGSQWQACQAEWYDSFRMAMNYAIHVLVALVDLAVDEAFGKASRGIWINCAGITDAVLHQIFAVGDKGGC